MKKIWLATAFSGIERVESYLQDLKREDPSSPEIILDYPKTGMRSIEDFLPVAKDYHGLAVTLAFPMNAKNLEQISHLEAITNVSVGFNNVDVEKVKELRIPYGNTPDILNEATADTALTLTLMCSRKILFAMNDIKNGGWQKFEFDRYNGIDPRTLRIGIIGMGRIGEVFAKKCYDLWGSKIYTLKRKSLENKKFDFPIHIVEEEEFYHEVNLLSLHCPLTDSTKGMVDKEFLARFKHPLIFINTARGAIHKEDDLIDALNEGKLLSVGLDVTDPEPMSKDHPLLKRDDAVIFPHIGSATDKTRREMTFMALNNVIEVLRGKPMPHTIF